MPQHAVGQVLYLVFKKDNKVIPALIVEEITRRTKEGVTTDHVIQIGSSDQPTMMNLSSLDGDVFSSADEAIETLTSRAHQTICKLVKNAVDKAKIWYGLSKPEAAPEPESNSISNLGEDDAGEMVSVTLPDGTRAKIAMPQRVA